MTGPSRHAVLPTIVVICEQYLLPHVEATLRSRYIEDQCNVLPAKNGLRRLLKKKVRNNDDHTQPQFSLQLYARDKAPRTLLSGIILDCEALVEDVSDGLWCGSKIINTTDCSRSTLACLLDIGGRIYSLTTAHGFEHAAPLLDQTSLTPQLACAVTVPERKSARLENLDWALITISNQFLTSSMAGSKEVTELGTIALALPREPRDVLVLSAVGIPKIGRLLCDTEYFLASVDEPKVPFWSVEVLGGQGL